ncbi:MAG: bis(5'-nucleosyl)-tetraphosphatase (symmetrical) YqeK [Anaerovoracaceae bacterium]
MDCTSEIRHYIENNFSEKRRVHTEGVRQTAVKLAEKYGADPKKAEIAALFHDMYRGVAEKTLNYYVKYLGLDDKYIDNANLAHGKIAAIIMERDFEITDPDIINAVSYHTTGRAGMSTLEKVVYLADAIEPNRFYPGVDELRKAAYEDLDKACLMSLKNTADYVQSAGKYLDENTIFAKKYLEKVIKEKNNLEEENDQ